MSCVDRGRGVVREREPNGISPSKKVGELRKEKKRRFYLSDSETESDHCVVSFRKRDCRTGVNGASPIVGQGNGVVWVKEGKHVEAEKKKNSKDLRTDFLEQSKEHEVAVKRKVARPEFGRKRSKEECDVGKREKNTPRNGGNKSKIVSSCGVEDKNGMVGEIYGGTEPLISSNEVTRENPAELNSYRISNIEAEQMKIIESSGNRKLRMNDNSNGIIDVGRDRTHMLRCKDGVLRVQGKGGVLRVLPSKKVDRLVNNQWKRKDKDNSKDSSSCRVTQAAMKQPTLSPDGIIHDKLSVGKKLGKNTFKNSEINIAERNRSNERKAEPEIVTRKKEKIRADISKNKAGLESGPDSKTAIVAEEQANNASTAPRTEKQKLRDQIKNILLNSGWTIDLRPRKGRNYEDSVYIPPGGHGGYWSITKAYQAYEEQQNRTCNARDKISSGRSSRTSSASDSIIPMESLDILRRVVVNKRKRKEESEEAQRNKMKKVKRTSDYRHRSQNFKDKHDETRGKESDCGLNSNSHTVISTARKQLQKGRNKQRGCALLVRGSNQEAEAEDDDYIPYVWKRTVLSWMIDMGVLHLNGKVRYMNQRRTKTKLEGWITRDGISCSCCSKILTLSKFELHAGSKLLQPSQNIFLEDGQVSLLQCQLDAWKRQDESERQGFYYVDVSGDDPNDDACGICGDGGDLICCDGCPSTFHLTCLGIEKLPPGDWHCTNCCCRYCGEISTDANGESDEAVSLFSCNQCEAKFHPDCVPEEESDSAITKNPNNFCCSQSCRKILKQLRKILGKKNDLEAGFSCSVVRRFDEDASKSPVKSTLMAECNPKIAVALAVMDECFLPIVDERSGINLIHNVVYNCGSNFSRLNYRGFYSFILERGDEIISVASIRIHGARLAEMPFIGTRNMYRRQGMCRRLLNGIESVLRSLNVEKLIIPAISELKDTWTNVFGFKPLAVTQELEVRSINILVFPGTGLLQKPLLNMHSSDPETPADGVRVVENNIMLQHETKSTKDAHCVNSTEDDGHNTSSLKLPHESSPGYNSPENAGVASMLTFPVGGLAGSLDEDRFQVDGSTDSAIVLTCKVTSFDDIKGQDVECNSITDYPAILKLTPPDNESSFQNLGQSLPCILSSNSVPTSLRHKFEDRCCSPDFVTPTLKQNVGNDEQPALCYSESTTPMYDFEPCGLATVHPSNSSVANGQKSPESIHDINHNDKSRMGHLETTIHVSSEEYRRSFRKDKIEEVLDPNCSAKAEYSESLTFEFVSRSENVGAEQEGGTSCSDGAAHNFSQRGKVMIGKNKLDVLHVESIMFEPKLSSVTNCKIPDEIQPSERTPLTQDTNTCNMQPDFRTSSMVPADSSAESEDMCNDVAL